MQITRTGSCLTNHSYAIGGQGVERGCLNLPAIATDIRIAHIIQHDEEDIGARFRTVQNPNTAKQNEHRPEKVHFESHFPLGDWDVVTN